MTDRDKVVRGLAACMPQTEEDAKISCAGCPYHGHPCGGNYQDNDHVNLPVALIEDIRALLKAQEPRVMTLEEIDQWKQLDVWMEKKGGEPDLCGDYIMPMSRLEFSFWHAIIVDGSKHPPIINGDYYGKTWRCWSARPSYEQMEATPWLSEK